MNQFEGVMSEKIQMDKEYVTRDGRKVRVLAVDKKGTNGYPVIGLVATADFESVGFWTECGKFHIGDDFHGNDLILAPRKFSVSRWFNIYRFIMDNELRVDGGFLTKSLADQGVKGPGYDRIACLEFSVKGVEGQGL